MSDNIYYVKSEDGESAYFQRIFQYCVIFPRFLIGFMSVYMNMPYNVRICVLSPVLFLRDSIIVPRPKNRSTGILRGRFFHKKTGRLILPVFLQNY